MRRPQQFVPVFLLAFVMLLFAPGCDLINGNGNGNNPGEDVQLSDLAGKWMRQASNNPSADGIRLEVVGNRGTITFKAASGFSVGDVKWEDITPSEDVFIHRELGSDGNYYNGQIQMISEDELSITVENSGAGNAQTWVRDDGSNPVIQPTVLECNFFTTERTLTNTDAAVDYVVPNNCVMDITAPLTIEPGVVIEFEENAGLGIYDQGTITVVGTESQPIILKGKEAIAGYWRGIHLETNSINNRFDYAQISDAGSNYVYCCNAVATLFLKDGKVSLKNTTISNGDGYGIYVRSQAEMREYENMSITTHNDYPVALSPERMNELDGTNSDYSGNSKDFVFVLSGDINGATSMSKLNVPYLFDGEVMDVTEQLFINAGVEMVMEADAGIGVFDNGSLVIDGNASDPVIIRGTSATRGVWRGIHLETNNIENRISHAQISDAGGNYVYCCNPIATIFLKDGTASIDNTSLSNGDGHGIVTAKNFSFRGFDRNTVSSHKLTAMLISMKQAGELDAESGFSGNDSNADFVEIYRDQVNVATTVNAFDVPMLLTSVIDITEGLTLSPGAVLTFENDGGLGVYDNGFLKAVGTDANKITFTSKAETAGSWRGIHIETTDNNNEITHSVVQYGAGNYVYCCNERTGILLKGGTLTLTESYIADNAGCGVFVRSGGTLTESGNTFANNTDGHICN
ncbi:MAG: hypothetical protein AAF206_08700 [Bacteroidota bacterium]